MEKSEPYIRIGTSGWYYEHWKGLFYPEDIPKSGWFEYYARHFDTVEINNTFYHLPKKKSVLKWQQIAPGNFVYAVKTSRYITHIQKLRDTSESLERFFEIIELLELKLGPVLYQLPPSLHFDSERLVTFLKLLPKNKAAVFEFRHKSWYCDDTYELLEKFGAGFCIHDMPGKESPRVITSDIIYVRFHGTTGRYSGSYPESQLNQWAKWLKEQNKTIRKIYIYFNNDTHGHAIKNAKQLKQIMKFSDD